MTESLYSKIAGLNLSVDALSLEPLELQVGGWRRLTTVVCLGGSGHEGRGEDVNYSRAEQQAFQAKDLKPLWLQTNFDGFCRALDHVDLAHGVDESPDARLFRRWAFESAALDLALRQNGLSLGEALGREHQPVQFVSSTGLGEPPSLVSLIAWLDADPTLRFKVDWSPQWSSEFCSSLAGLDVVDVVDLKGLYRGSFRGPEPSAEGYSRVLEHFPTAWIEDPAITDETKGCLEPARDRITWDANLHSLSDLIQLQDVPRCINIKPSRFGRVEELLRVYEYCESRDIAMYGGGQFELGPGRRQVQVLASLFHPDSPNDVAPSAFNEGSARPGLPTSPIPPSEFSASRGF